MLTDYPRSSSTKIFSLLAIEDNTDHQLLIGYSLRARIPQAQPIFAKTPDEALGYLQAACSDPDVFPRLVLLDLYLPNLNQGWQLLAELRSRYPRLPIVVLSSNQEPAVISQAYELGAHSFLSKPLGIDNWEYCFQVLNEYWFGTITLSPS